MKTCRSCHETFPCDIDSDRRKCDKCRKPRYIPKPRGSRKQTYLTARELEVVRLIADGRKYHEIGAILRITEGTVKEYVHRACARHGLHSRTALVLFVYAHDREAAA